MGKELEVFFGESRINIIEKDGVKWIRAADVARALDYMNTRDAVHKFMKTNEEILTGGVCQFHTPTKSGIQEAWYFNEKGLMAFLVKTNQPKAIPFQKWAISTLANEVKKTVDKSAEYKTLRIKSKRIRNGFTNTLKDHGIKQPSEFVAITYATKTSLGIDQYRPKSELDIWELCQVSMSETLATYQIAVKDPNGLKEVLPVVSNCSKKIQSLSKD